MFEGILTVVSGRSAPFRCLGHGLTAGVDSWEVTACSLQCYCLLTCHHLELQPGHPLTAALLSLSLRSVSSGFQLTFVLEILGTSNYTLKKKKKNSWATCQPFPWSNRSSSCFHPPEVSCYRKRSHCSKEKGVNSSVCGFAPHTSSQECQSGCSEEWCTSWELQCTSDPGEFAIGKVISRVMGLEHWGTFELNLCRRQGWAVFHVIPVAMFLKLINFMYLMGSLQQP